MLIISICVQDLAITHQQGWHAIKPSQLTNRLFIGLFNSEIWSIYKLLQGQEGVTRCVMAKMVEYIFEVGVFEFHSR